MRIVDLNVLLYAVNLACGAARLCTQLVVEKALNDEDTVGLTWVVLLGFLRLATNSRVFPCPLTPDVAAAKLDAWLSLDNVRVVREKDDHWETLRSLLRDAGTAGNLTTDAHLAALALSHDAVLVCITPPGNTSRNWRRERHRLVSEKHGQPQFFSNALRATYSRSGSIRRTCAGSCRTRTMKRCWFRRPARYSIRRATRRAMCRSSWPGAWSASAAAPAPIPARPL